MYKLILLLSITGMFFMGCSEIADVIDPKHPVKTIVLNQKTASVEIGKTITLSYVIDPTNADNAAVNWSSSRDSVANVSTQGVVRGLKLGHSTITVTTVDGSKSDTCHVNVIPVVFDIVYIDIPTSGEPLGWADFKMGNNDNNSSEKPLHAVSLTKHIKLSTHEITNQQYCDVLNFAKNASLITSDFETTGIVKNSQGSKQPLINLNGYLDSYNSCAIKYDKSANKFIVTGGKNNQPVTFISWYGAAFFCNMLGRQEGKNELYNVVNWQCSFYNTIGYRLPTEAEWEYSSSYNDRRVYPWGIGFNQNYANCNQNQSSVTDVGSYPTGKSKLGLQDFAGNVSEWCQDWYSGRYYQVSPNQNPTGPLEGSVKVLRGGSWYSPTDFLRCQARDFAQPVNMLHDYGFRIALVEGM